jgi:ribose transport system substrate-binding protein
VIKRAQDAGIIVVSFDNIVTTPGAVLVNEDQTDFGKRLAEDLVKRIGGKGNVVMVNGVAGTSVSNDRTAGAKAVFANSPDIKVIKEMEGNWDSGTGQKVMADFLATKPKIDAVWAQGGTPGIVKAFTDAGLELPPMAGEAENGYRKALAASKAGGISIGQTPSMIAVSIQVALAALKGQELPRVIAMPLPIAASEDLKEGVNYFKDLNDEFFVAVSVPACGVNLTPAQILAEQAK